MLHPDAPQAPKILDFCRGSSFYHMPDVGVQAPMVCIPRLVNNGGMTAPAPLPYEEVSTQDFAEAAASTWTFAYEPRRKPEVIIFEGKCPRCSHPSTFHYPIRLVRGTPLVNSEVTVFCRCREKHDEDEAKKGCGCYWDFEVPDHE